MGRLQLENSVFANQSFGYDLNGNRQSNGSNAYTYQPNSNRMATRKGTALSRDAAGNHTSNGLGQTYSWDNHGHFSQFTLNGVKKATYLYNHQHQRTHKTLWNGATALGTTVYHYDLKGRLLMETSSTGAILATYIYDEAGVPLGLFWESLSPPVYDEVGRFTDWAINHSFGDCVGIGNVMRLFGNSRGIAKKAGNMTGFDGDLAMPTN